MNLCIYIRRFPPPDNPFLEPYLIDVGRPLLSPSSFPYSPTDVNNIFFRWMIHHGKNLHAVSAHIWEEERAGGREEEKGVGRLEEDQRQKSEEVEE